MLIASPLCFLCSVIRLHVAREQNDPTLALVRQRSRPDPSPPLLQRDHLGRREQLQLQRVVEARAEVEPARDDRTGEAKGGWEGCGARG